MNIQVDFYWTLGAIFTSTMAVIGFLWRQFQQLKQDQRERFAELERGRAEWQKTWTDLLQQHMAHEEKEFDRLRELQLAFVQIQQKAINYVTQRDLEQTLKPLYDAIEEIRSMIDARKVRRVDPISGRPNIA